MKSKQSTLGLVAVLLALATGASCLGNAESAGMWMKFYAPALGLADNKDLPYPGEYADDFSALVADPTPLTTFGLRVARGDHVHFTNHGNGYWTITHETTKRSVRLPLGYQVRFGIVPDKEPPEGEPPDRIVGRVTDPRLLEQCGFVTAHNARRFTLEYIDEGWLLTLDPSGEKRKIPF